MTAIISTTYDDKYFWSLPLVTWCWNKLGVGVICFLPLRIPFNDDKKEVHKMYEAINLSKRQGLSVQFYISLKHKEATYSQCARLYAACLDLPEDEILITSDVDMIVLNKDFIYSSVDKMIDIYGADLVPQKQYPMCYSVGTAKDLRVAMNINGRTYQQCLDDLLGDIEAEHFRGNYWGKDQETLFNNIQSCEEIDVITHNRARPGTQFASRRYDRDDSYLLDRLDPDTIDFHLPRPGYDEKNFEIIMKVLEYHYPHEDFTWLVEYTEAYKKLL